jgi:CSLREA domain-containing protein
MINVSCSLAGNRPAVALSCLVLLVSLAAASPAAQAAEYAYFNVQPGINAVDTADFTPVGNIPLPGSSLWGMATCPQTRRLYAFDINTQTVNVVDTALGQVVGSIPLPGLLFTPYGMDADTECARLYFAADKPKGLIAVDLALGLVMAEIPVPNAFRVVAQPAGGKIYVTTKFGELYVVRASDFQILSHTNYAGEELAINAAGTRVYVAGARGNVAVIDTATDSQVGTLPVPFRVNFLTVSGRWLYVGNKEMGKLGIIDAVDAHVEKEITLEADRWVRVGGIDVTEDGSRVVVLFDNDLRYKYAVVDGNTQTLLSVTPGLDRGLLCRSRFITTVQTTATTFTADSTADAVDADPGDGVCETGTGNGVCTLRAAVQEANATPGSSLIELSAGDYTLAIPGMDEDGAASGDLDVLGNLTIRGVDRLQTIIDGSALDRVFHVLSGGNLHLEQLMVQNGYLKHRDPASSTNEPGAGIYNPSGMLRLTNAGVCRNKIEGFGGAGIDSRGTLYAEDSVFSDNQSEGWFRYESKSKLKLYKGAAAISAGTGELKRCTAERNTGAIAVQIAGPVSDSVFRGNKAAGLAATTVTRCVIANNRGRGCTAQTVVDSSVRNNANDLPLSQGDGGGIYNTSGKLTVIRTTVKGNTATRGGGVYAKWLEMVNSTVSGNSARESGGGIYTEAYGEWGEIRSSTITNNTADSDADGSGDGGGLYFPTSLPTTYNTTLYSTILAGNHDRGEEAPDCSGFFPSGLFNLLGIASGCGLAAGAWDIAGTATSPVDPLLGPLASNGGLSSTHSLLPGSPAIDAAHLYLFESTDQRGVSRPRDGNGDGVKRADIGAFELRSFE